jgi:hypothetical protein
MPMATSSRASLVLAMLKSELLLVTISKIALWMCVSMLLKALQTMKSY